jgi:hypothetical protein
MCEECIIKERKRQQAQYKGESDAEADSAPAHRSMAAASSPKVPTARTCWSRT